MVDDGVGDALARLAGRQDGIVTSADLVALGITHRQIHGWCRNGRLQRLRRGLFAVGYQPNNQRAHRRAGLLAVGPTSALGFSTSLSHREIVELRGEEDLLHVVTGCGSPRSPDGVTLHRLSFLDERDVDVVDGLRCTSVALTLIHLAGSLASSVPRTWSAQASGGPSSRIPTRSLSAPTTHDRPVSGVFASSQSARGPAVISRSTRPDAGAATGARSTAPAPVCRDGPTTKWSPTCTGAGPSPESVSVDADPRTRSVSRPPATVR